MWGDIGDIASLHYIYPHYHHLRCVADEFGASLVVFSWQGSPVICQDNSACSHELLQLTCSQITHPVMEWS